MNLRVEGKQKRALATRTHILDSFAALMATRSYDEISIAQIAQHAEVGKGTVLAHFSEKLALAATMIAQELAHCHRRTQALSHIDNAQQLRAIFEPLFLLVMKDDVFIRLTVGEGQQICRQLIEPVELDLFAEIAQKLARSARARPECDLVALRAFLVHAAVMYRACDGGQAVIDEFEQLLDHYLF